MEKRALSVYLVAELNQDLKEMLCQHRTELEIATSLEKAEARIAKKAFCLIVLDVSAVALQRIVQGLERIRKSTFAPVLLLAPPEEHDELITAGADFCLPPDADSRAVVSTAFAMLRRHTFYNPYDTIWPNTVIYRGGLVMDHLRHQVTLDGKEIHFTPKEYKLLLYFARNPGIVISADQICETVWGVGFDENRDVTTVIAELRRKLKDTRENPVYIKTVHGFGYTFLPKE